MPLDLLFVHGTGVRAPAFAQTFALLQRQLARHSTQARLHGLFWGASHGARLALNGASVPTYHETGGGDTANASLLWEALLFDPECELRGLAAQDPVRALPGTTPRWHTWADRIRAHKPMNYPGAQGEPEPRHDLWELSVAKAKQSPLIDLAARGADSYANLAHSYARFVIASYVGELAHGGFPTPSTSAQQQAAASIIAELGATTLGIPAPLQSAITNIVARTGSRHLMKRRGSLTDNATPLAGDVLAYVRSPEVFRSLVQQKVASIPSENLFLMGHSLGGVMCADLMLNENPSAVRGLITIGSQVGYLAELGLLPNTLWDRCANGTSPWLNVFDRRDALSYLAQPIYGDYVVDFEVDNGQPFPFSHSSYWESDKMWAAITNVVAP